MCFGTKYRKQRLGINRSWFRSVFLMWVKNVYWTAIRRCSSSIPSSTWLTLSQPFHLDTFAQSWPLSAENIDPHQVQSCYAPRSPWRWNRQVPNQRDKWRILHCIEMPLHFLHSRRICYPWSVRTVLDVVMRKRDMNLVKWIEKVW